MEQQRQVPDGYLAGYDGYGRDWVSTSSLSLLMMCPVAWEKKYALRIPAPTNVRMTAGSACHKGREVNLKQKVDSHEDVSEDVVTDAARDCVNKTFDEREVVSEKEFADMSKEDARGMTVDMAVTFVVTDYTEFQLGIQPSMVEKSLAIKFKDLDRIICGQIDTVNEDGWVDDLKTGKRAKGQAFADTSMGLSTYGMLYLAHMGKAPPGYRIHNVVQGKSGCKTHVYETTRTEEDLNRQLARFQRALELIKSGVFMPCDPGFWKCSEGWCEYWFQCKFGGGK